MTTQQERLYSDLAAWWPLLSRPEDYAEEAEFYRQTMDEASSQPVKHVMELGSGGGNNASHLKKHYRMTLVDRSPGMLAVSRNLNPECEHILGDMRTVRLGREFDAVFIHDAIVYMTTHSDLRKAIETAHVHCRPGGVVLLVPDFVRETFKEYIEHGGHDHGERGLRYLMWTRDPDPADEPYEVDFAYLLREENGQVRCEYDRHICGLFSQGEWLRVMEEVGFAPRAVPSPVEGTESHIVFVGVKAKGI